MGQKSALKDTLYSSPRYKSFIDDRNRALERVMQNAQLDVSRLTHEALESIAGFVSHMILTKELKPERVQPAAQALNQFIDAKFHHTAQLIEQRIIRLRRSTYMLSYLGELEAVARATKRTMQADTFEFKKQLDEQGGALDLNGKPLNVFIFQAFHKLKSKIVNAFISAVATDKDGQELLQAVEKVFPPIAVYQKPPRAIKPLHEADPGDPKEKKEFDFYHDLTNNEDWDLAVDAYKQSDLPSTRFDDEVFYNPKTGTAQYSWELEQNITDDFVKQVRDGQVQAANDLGVKDFVWVAVIDKKTCEVCCMPRAGKLTSEIEAMLKSGELDKDECDAVTPPAHANCLPGSALIDIHYPVFKIFRRRYSNTMASIITDDGSILHATANHPILTQKGWQSPKDIKIGDYLIGPLAQGVQTGNIDSQNVKPTFEDLFNAVSFFGEITSRLQSSADFHNDGIADEQVDIISINRELILNRIAEFLENETHFFFQWSNLSDFSDRSLPQHWLRDFSTSGGRMSFVRECEAFLRTHSRHPQNISLASIPGNNSILEKPSTNSSSVNAILPGHSEFTHPILIILDRLLRNWECSCSPSPVPPRNDLYSSPAHMLAQIVGVMSNDFGDIGQSKSGLVKFNRVRDCFFSDFSGHVYNLQTDINWYIADNFIVHNCRCDISPVASTDSVEGPNWKDFDEWLNS